MLPTMTELAAAMVARQEMPPEKGELGPIGLPGRDGESIVGPKGDKGDPGRNIYSGMGPPPDRLGLGQDLYIDIRTGDLWELR